MVDKNDTLMREVDEELRREQLEKLWKRHGNHILMAAVAAIAAYALFQVWQGRRIAAAEAAGAAFEDARRQIADGKPQDAAKALETLAKGGQAGYAELASLQLAGSELKAGRKAEALAIFERLGKESAADPMLRDYARLQAASLRLGEADFAEIQSRLSDIIGDKNPWRANGRELLGLAAMKAGKTELAKATFQQLLGDRSTPQGVSEVARIAMDRLVAMELAQPAPASTPANAGAAAATGGQPAAQTGAQPAGMSGSESKPATQPPKAGATPGQK